MTRMSTPAARTGSSPAAPRNGATAIASSGRMKAEPTFVAAYWWRVHPGKEDQFRAAWHRGRSEEHTSELQSLMRISYAVFCLKKKQIITTITIQITENNNHNNTKYK